MRLEFAILIIAACASAEPPTSTSSDPIIGPSHPAAIGELPATGALLSSALGSPSLECTGTLIAPNAVLTAAHCVDPAFIGTEIPSFTFERYAYMVPAASVYAGASVHPNPDWTSNVPLGQLSHANDIGILLLADPITSVMPASLPAADEASRVAVGLDVTLAGYGLSDGYDEDAGIPGFSYKRVGSAHVDQVGDWEVAVARSGDAGACNGDSGGPAYATIGDTGESRVIATVSRGLASMDCTKGGIFTRVDPYVSWIQTVISMPCGGPSQPACPSPEDAGVPDDAAMPRNPETGRAGCGCNATDESLRSTATLVLLVGFVTRRRRRTPRSGLALIS